MTLLLAEVSDVDDGGGVGGDQAQDGAWGHGFETPLGLENGQGTLIARDVELFIGVRHRVPFRFLVAKRHGSDYTINRHKIGFNWLVLVFG